MSLEICVLGSGSAGNSSALRGPGGTVLIDIGFGPRATAKRLAGVAAAIDDVRAVCLTHLDSDHFNRNWVNTLIKRQIRVFCHESLIEPILEMAGGDLFGPGARLRPLIEPFDGRCFSPLEGISMHPVRLPHDRAGSHGFRIDHAAGCIGYATDLGTVPAELLECFDGLDLLALESNYDRQMQIDSPRPWFLKQRIMGGAGHLSNEQSLAAVRHILDREDARSGGRLPGRIVLLHRSRDCNCPGIVRRLFEADPRIAERLVLAEQGEATEWLRSPSTKE